MPESVKTTLGSTNVEIMNNIITDIMIQSYGKPYIQMSENVYEQVEKLKKFNYENIYYKAMDNKEKKYITNMFNELYEVYINALEKEDKSNDIYEVFLKDMNVEYLNNSNNDEKVIDFIASMTDNYIQKQYDKYIK